MFYKSNQTITHPNAPVLVSKVAQREELDYEVELAIVIGRDCKDATVENAYDFVTGYTCANDITARKHQAESSQWSFSKSKVAPPRATFGRLPCQVSTIFAQSVLALCLLERRSILTSWNCRQRLVAECFKAGHLRLWSSASQSKPKAVHDCRNQLTPSALSFTFHRDPHCPLEP